MLQTVSIFSLKNIIGAAIVSLYHPEFKQGQFFMWEIGKKFTTKYIRSSLELYCNLHPLLKECFKTSHNKEKITMKMKTKKDVIQFMHLSTKANSIITTLGVEETRTLEYCRESGQRILFLYVGKLP